MDTTIPDALAADLRDHFLAAQPLTTALPAASILLKIETLQLPSPRLLILPADPARVPGQHATARIPFTLQYTSSLDRQTPDAQRAIAGEIETWLRELRLTKRRALLHSRIYLHDIYTLHPTYNISTEDREQTAIIRGEALATLALVTLDP